MANANQVIVNGETILDLRSDTVTPETLQKGYTAHDKSGTKITGTLEASSVSVQPSKSVTYTSNGTATITPDEGYDAMSSVDVTVNAEPSGVKVTFPAAAGRWERANVDIASVLLADGTTIEFIDFSAVAGKTIGGVVAITVFTYAYNSLDVSFDTQVYCIVDASIQNATFQKTIPISYNYSTTYVIMPVKNTEILTIRAFSSD